MDPEQDSTRTLTEDENRFLTYQDTYRKTTLPKLPAPAPMSNTSKAVKISGARYNRYGSSRVSPAATARLKQNSGGQ
jgi:hypothetical protein